MAGFVVAQGPNRGSIHTLLPDLNRLGRDPGCDVVVFDEQASRQHAEVRHQLDGDQERFVLADLGSRNGTRLNGLRVEDEVALRPGDVVGIGDVRLVFVSGEGGSAQISLGRSTIHLDLSPADRPLARTRPPSAGAVGLDAPLLGASPALLDVQRQLHKLAPTNAAVLITGESGTGKELVARALHHRSGRRGGPFVAINAATLRGDLLESELFGHEKGAFTGAVARRKGAFELAAGGTLFLDELGELPAESQASLLRVLDGGGFRRVGGGEVLAPDVRLVAATNRDLDRAVKGGGFRLDLLHRIGAIRLELPPLRERTGDVRILAEAFLREVHQQSGCAARSWSEDALAALETYAWPGNVRELKNGVERVAIFCEGECVQVGDLPAHVSSAPSPAKAGEGGSFPCLQDVEREHIAKALARTGWNKTQAAKLLGIDRVTLYKRIARYELAP